MLSSFFKPKCLFPCRCSGGKAWISNWNKVWSVTRFTIINRTFNISHKTHPMKVFFPKENKKSGTEWHLLFWSLFVLWFIWRGPESHFLLQRETYLSFSEKQLVFVSIRKSPLPKVFFKHHSQPSPASGLVAFIVLHRVLSIWRHYRRKLICTTGAGLNQTQYIQYYHLLARATRIVLYMLP